MKTQMGSSARTASASLQSRWALGGSWSALENLDVIGGQWTSEEANGHSSVVQQVTTTLSSHLLPWKNAESTTDKCLTGPWVYRPRYYHYF